MLFVNRELERLGRALRKPNNRREELYAAQQALSWALDPQAFKSPVEMLMRTPVDSEDCSAGTHHSRLPDTSVPTSDERELQSTRCRHLR